MGAIALTSTAVSTGVTWIGGGFAGAALFDGFLARATAEIGQGLLGAATGLLPGVPDYPNLNLTAMESLLREHFPSFPELPFIGLADLSLPAVLATINALFPLPDLAGSSGGGLNLVSLVAHLSAQLFGSPCPPETPEDSSTDSVSLFASVREQPRDSSDHEVQSPDGLSESSGQPPLDQSSTDEVADVPLARGDTSPTTAGTNSAEPVELSPTDQNGDDYPPTVAISESAPEQSPDSAPKHALPDLTEVEVEAEYVPRHALSEVAPDHSASTSPRHALPEQAGRGSEYVPRHASAASPPKHARGDGLQRTNTTHSADNSYSQTHSRDTSGGGPVASSSGRHAASTLADSQPDAA
jgi:hypothetical protein